MLDSMFDIFFGLVVVGVAFVLGFTAGESRGFEDAKKISDRHIEEIELELQPSRDAKGRFVKR